jgi:hypothetical protein
MARIRGNGVIVGTPQDDHISGGNGDDFITGGGGNDDIDGGRGRDTAAFSQEFFRSSISGHDHPHDRLTVTGPDGRDRLSDIEVLRFGALEIDVNGSIVSAASSSHGHGHGHGRGHEEHGRGKGKGHDHHDHDHDGGSTLFLAGINNVNHGPGDQATRFSLLADGSAMNSEARFGSVTIDDVPGDGRWDEALHLVTDTNGGRLRLNNLWDNDQQITLGELDTLEFDYYIDSADRTDVIPVIRLIIDADGNLATTTDRGELVFEWAYQGFGPTTIDAWQHADLAGDDWVAWQRSNGMNWDQIVNMTELSDWADADGFTPVGGIHFDEDSLVIGWSVALGSGNGAADMYVDNLQIGPTTYEFVA